MLQFRFSPKFLSDSVWSLFGVVVSVATGLAVVKIISTLVVVQAYGQASLVLGFIALLNSILIGPFMVAHLRIYFDYLERGLDLWFSKTLSHILIVASMAAFLIYIVIAVVYNATWVPIYLELILPVAALIILQPQMSALTNYLEAHREQCRLAMVNILQKALQPAILFVLLATPISRPSAIIWTQSLAILPFLLIFWRPSKKKFSNKKPEDHRKELIELKKSFFSFGWALPLGYFVHWILSTSDRYLIQHFMTLGDVGVYVMNYGFWSMPYLMLNGWLEILTRPLVYDKAAKNDWHGVIRVLRHRILLGAVLCILGTLTLLMVARPIAAVMLGDHYWVDRRLMTALAVAHCFFVGGYSLVPLFLAAKKTKAILWATSIAAGINFSINFFAIPILGIHGAALTALLAYLVWFLLLSRSTFVFMKDLASFQIKEAEKPSSLKAFPGYSY